MRTLLHVGMPKCASTSLQESLFPQVADKINYLGISYKLDKDKTSVGRRLAAALARREQIDRQSVKQELEEDRLNVLSNELILRPWSIWPPFRELPTLSDWPGRLKTLLDSNGKNDIRVLVVVRRQPELILSAYNYNLVSIKKDARFREIDSLIEELRTNRKAYAQFDYSAILNAYAEAFAPENVKCLLFEDLANDPKAFCSQLAEELPCETDLIVGALNHRHRDASKSNARYRLRSKMITRILSNFGYGYYPTGAFRHIKRVMPRWTFQAIRGALARREDTVGLTDMNRDAILDMYSKKNICISQFGPTLDRLKDYGYITS